MTNLTWTMLAQADPFGGGHGGGGDIGMGAAIAAMMVPLLIFGAIFLLLIVGQVKIFTKAGKSWWSAIVPIYNFIVLAEIVGRPQWWGICAAVVPCLNIVFPVIMLFDLAKSFGKSSGFAVLMLLFPMIGIPLLGFGDAKYLGPSVQPA